MDAWTLQTETGDVQNASLHTVLRSLGALGEAHGTAGLALLDNDVNAVLIASFDNLNRLGYFVNVRQRDEETEQVLVDLSLGRTVVVGNIGGQSDERPRFVFVNYDVARRALHTFFKTGQRDASLTWLPFQETT